LNLWRFQGTNQGGVTDPEREKECEIKLNREKVRKSKEAREKEGYWQEIRGLPDKGGRAK
jgi:hypothetical protein